tara:strand:- start:851 stop:1135 length:285 start_codon:yes stop_codon:yes gene_type:complete
MSEKMYKAVNGEVIEMTDEEVAAFKASLPTEAEILADKWVGVRALRNAKLSETDWRASSDLTLSDEWKTYRQELRDVPSSQSDPNNITWPTEPS